jgi:hypothetical protein
MDRSGQVTYYDRQRGDESIIGDEERAAAMEVGADGHSIASDFVLNFVREAGYTL